MGIQPNIFLLKPILKKDEFREILIWAANEVTARRNACNTSLAAPRGTSTPPNSEDYTFYESTLNATCEQLERSQLINMDRIDHKLCFYYNQRYYELMENDPEAIQIYP